jgi:hypothetical protein
MPAVLCRARRRILRLKTKPQEWLRTFSWFPVRGHTRRLDCVNSAYHPTNAVSRTSRHESLRRENHRRESRLSATATSATAPPPGASAVVLDATSAEVPTMPTQEMQSNTPTARQRVTMLRKVDMFLVIDWLSPAIRSIIPSRCQRVCFLRKAIASTRAWFGRPIRITGQDFHCSVPKISRPFRGVFSGGIRGEQVLEPDGQWSRAPATWGTKEARSS